MGFADRDYYRNAPRRGGFGSWPSWSATVWLIVINVAVFAVDGILKNGPFDRGPLTRLGEFSVYWAIFHLQIWRFITFQFLHANLSHIFFNMLALYFFGPLVEQYLGTRRFIAFYLLCGIAGAALYTALWAAHILGVLSFTGLIGASAGIFGVLIAAACIAPDMTVMLLFPPIPMRMRTLAWIFVGIGAWTVLSRGFNAGGEAAHLGGAAVGYLLIRKPQLLNIFAGWPRFSRRPPRGRFRMDDWR